MSAQSADPFSVKGCRVLVTGAGRGIGRGIADVLAAAGASVAINALTPTYAVPSAQHIARSTGERCIALTGDITTSGGARAVVDRARAELGGIDVLVNALGDSLGGPFAAEKDSYATSDDDVARALDVNLMAAVHCSRAVGADFLASGNGTVVNIASVAAFLGGADTVIYTAAKTALVGLTRALALEWAPHGVRVNAVAPGLVPDADSQGPELRARLGALAATFPLGRVGTPAEVGHLVQYLISPASSYVTGQTFVIDGGWSLGHWTLPPPASPDQPTESA